MIQIWPGLGFGGALVNLQADRLGPGEGDEAGLGMLDDGVAEGCAGAGAEVDHAGRHARLFQHLDEFGGDGGRVAGGLQNHRVAGDDGGCGHARHDGEGEVPRRNHRAHAERNIEQFVALAGVLDGRGGGGQAQSFAGIELKEIDGFAHVGVGLGPVLAHLIGEPGAELELAPADDLGRAQEQGNPVLDGSPAPGFKGPERRLPWPLRRAPRRPSGGCRRPGRAARGSGSESCLPF